jgi:catechol 2,3-dioxygenase-like lactoylglutathione lyase family enzyme
MAINYRSAVFFVKDIQASRRFYEHLIGQEVLMDHGPNIGYKAGFALWDVSHALEMIFGANKTAAGDNSELYFETDDLEET